MLPAASMQARSSAASCWPCFAHMPSSATQLLLDTPTRGITAWLPSCARGAGSVSFMAACAAGKAAKPSGVDGVGFCGGRLCSNEARQRLAGHPCWLADLVGWIVCYAAKA
jgi:hypothetical protein